MIALFALSLLASEPATAAVPAPSMPAGAPVAAPAELDGRKLLLKCEKQFLKLTSLKGTIKDRGIHHEAGGAPDQDEVVETESDFLYKRYDDVRFENVVPVPHSVIWNGTTLWVWSPQENAAVQEKADDVPMGTRAALSLQPGYGIDLLAPIPIDEYAASVKKAEGPAGSAIVVTLTPVDTSHPRATMQLVVDPEKLLVTRIVSSFGEGAAISDVELSSPVEAAPGIWFETQVHSRTRLADGSSLEQLRTFERLKFNVPIEDSNFSFKVPDGVKVVPLAGASFSGGQGAAGKKSEQ